MVWHKIPGWNRAALLASEGRIHVQLGGRFITVLSHKQKLFALDSPCFHASGPLGDGPVKDIEDIPCIECPWHHMLVALDTGEEVVREIVAPLFDENGVYRPPSQMMKLTEAPTAPGQPYPESWLGPPKRKAPVQRTHAVEEREDELWVDVWDGPTSSPPPQHASASDTQASVDVQAPVIKTKFPPRLASDRPAYDQLRGPLCIKLQRERLQVLEGQGTSGDAPNQS